MAAMWALTSAHLTVLMKAALTDEKMVGVMEMNLVDEMVVLKATCLVVMMALHLVGL
jgi:hypothetical protein